MILEFQINNITLQKAVNELKSAFENGSGNDEEFSFLTGVI